MTLLIDEAFAFDYLSILQVKSLRIKSEINDKNFKIQSNHIESQIGELFETILNSKEYNDLMIANQKTFTAVDDAKQDLVKASYVDKCNFERFVAKKQLQLVFFNKELSETKIGYEIYK